MKITEKVSFNITRGASYVYILSRQKLISRMPKMVHFGEFFENLKLAVKKVLPDKSIFNRTKIDGKCQRFKCDTLSNFQTM